MPTAIEIDKYSDRRLFERFPSRFPAKIKDSREEFGTHIQLRDASAMGARISSREKFFVNDSIVLEVQLPDGLSPMSLKGAVIWAKQLEGNMWSIGLKFPKIHFMQSQRLYKFAHPDAT